MKFNVIEFPSSLFTFTGNNMCAEASDMENRHLQPLYGGGAARDVGFAVKSTKTDKVVTFVMQSPFYSGDGEDRELAGWYYVPTSESFRNVPECQNMTATVFND